jgi:hypothetical protein
MILKIPFLFNLKIYIIGDLITTDPAFMGLAFHFNSL